MIIVQLWFKIFEKFLKIFKVWAKFFSKKRLFWKKQKFQDESTEQKTYIFAENSIQITSSVHKTALKRFAQVIQEVHIASKIRLS